MRLNDLVATSYEISKSKGWYDGPLPRHGDRVALIVSELSEALEEFRHGHAPSVTYMPRAGTDGVEGTLLDLARQGYKPEGIPPELADVAIRCADAAGGYGYDLEAALRSDQFYSEPLAGLTSLTIGDLQKTRLPGCGLFTDESELVSFGDWCTAATIAACYGAFSTSDGLRARSLAATIWTVCRMAQKYDIDLEHAIEVKEAFNRTRPYRHGNKIL